MAVSSKSPDTLPDTLNFSEDINKYFSAKTAQAVKKL